MAANQYPVTIYDEVSARLDASAPPSETIELWLEIQREFGENGPQSVKEMLEQRVRSLVNTAKKDLKATRSVAKDVAPPKRKSSAAKKPSTKRVARTSR